VILRKFPEEISSYRKYCKQNFSYRNKDLQNYYIQLLNITN